MNRASAPVVLAGSRELLGGTRWVGLFLVAWGAIFAGGPLSMVHGNAHSMRESAAMVFIFVMLGLAAMFGGIYLLLVGKHVRCYAARRLIEETRGFLGESKVERTPLAAFTRVLLVAQRGRNNGISYALSLDGPAGKAVSLGASFTGREHAVAAGIRAASATGLPLDEQHEDGRTVRLPAGQLARLPAQEALDAPGLRSRWRPSALALVAANLVPLAGVLWLDWEILPLMLLYWLENVVIGVYTLARMLLARGERAARLPATPGNLLLCAFFTFHFGIFCSVHGMFIFFLFGSSKQVPGGAFGPGAVLDLVAEALFRHGLFVAALALVVSHGVSFWMNYVRARAFEDAAAGTLMVAPYKRVCILHVAILSGAFIAEKSGGTVLPLALLVALKTAVDLAAHLSQFRSQSLHHYDALAEEVGEERARPEAPDAALAAPPASPNPKGPDPNDRPLSYYLGKWRLAPGEAALPGWFADVEFREAQGKVEVSLTSQGGDPVAQEELEAMSMRGSAASVDYFEVRLRGGGRQRILRFTASGTNSEGLDVHEVRYPEGNPKAMEARAFALRRR